MTRMAVAAAQSGNPDDIRSELEAEERRERDLDRMYWEPLKAELERLRHPRDG